MDQLCVVRNLSTGGLMFECLHLPQVEQKVVVELRSDKQMPGIVRAVGPDYARIAFDRPVDIDQILKEERNTLLRVRPRAPRFARRGSVRMICNGETVFASIVDIAIGGLSCRPERPLRRGEPLVASIDGIGATNAEARWIKDGVAGIRFESPLPWRSFQTWLDQSPH
jgi:hypothetical protein